MLKFRTVASVAFSVAAIGVASGANYNWNVSGSGNWAVNGNWTVADYPGFNSPDNTDSAFISKTNSNVAYTVTVNSSIQYDLNALEVRADSADADVTLKIDSGADLDVTDATNFDSTIRLVAGQHALSPVADDAKFWFAAGTLGVDNFDLQGGNRASTFGDRGLAILDVDGDLPVINDVVMSNEVQLDILTSMTLTVSGTLSLADSGVAYAQKIGSGDIVAGAFEIVNSSGGSTITFEVTAGSISTN